MIVALNTNKDELSYKDEGEIGIEEDENHQVDQIRI